MFGRETERFPATSALARGGRSGGAEAGDRSWPKAGRFSLDDDLAYAEWRDQTLARHPTMAEDLVVEMRDLAEPTPGERAEILRRIDAANMALYATNADAGDDELSRRNLIAFGAAFGMVAIEDHRSAGADGIVRIEVVDGGGRLGYIPYTDKPINWHTDGYYNFHGPDLAIAAMLLHCRRPAASGGINRLLDPEIAYIRLRDEDPSLIEALMRVDAMTIPAGEEAGGRPRPDNVGPVFFVHPRSGALGMRFTARRRNVVWRDDPLTHRAVQSLLGVLHDDPLIVETRLAAGEGVICNNVLHDRSVFSGGSRLLYRVRYTDRVGQPGALS